MKQPPHSTLTPQAILHDFFNVSLFEAKTSIEKAIGSVAEPFSNGKLAKKGLVACAACAHHGVMPLHC
jgi:hypothetical protein